MSPLELDDLTRATRLLAGMRRPLLISHARPDGDALGSLVAMRSMLGGQNIDVLALLFEKWPKRYAVLGDSGSMPALGEDVQEADLADRDGVIILDTCAYSQLGPIADWLRRATIPKLAVDHHLTRDELADSYLVDESAAANCLIIYDWARANGWPIDRPAGDALFVGIAMDTGWFRFSNTDARVLAAAGDLVARGAKPHELFQSLFQQDSPGRVRLLGAALSSLELCADARLAVMTLTSSDFRGADATPADTENVVNEPLRITSVAVSVLLVEQGDGVIRVSLRSKPPTRKVDPDVDVAAIAQLFGGGGHQRAAGARISGSLPAIRREITQSIQRILPPSGTCRI